MEQFEYKNRSNIMRQGLIDRIAQLDKEWRYVHDEMDKFEERRNTLRPKLIKINKERDNLELQLKATPLQPEVGMGGTIGYNGDAYPYTIHKVSEDLKTIWASQDDYKYEGTPIVWGEEYDQSFTNERPESEWSRFVLRKNGRYVRKGAGLNSVWDTLYIGHRSYRQNPSF